VFFLRRSLFRQFDDVFTALRFGSIHFPAGGFQLIYRRLNERFYGKTTSCGVINDNSTAHGRIIPEPPSQQFCVVPYFTAIILNSQVSFPVALQEISSTSKFCPVAQKRLS